MLFPYISTVMTYLVHEKLNLKILFLSFSQKFHPLKFSAYTVVLGSKNILLPVYSITNINQFSVIQGTHFDQAQLTFKSAVLLAMCSE